jgi:hypothetical protein
MRRARRRSCRLPRQPEITTEKDAASRWASGAEFADAIGENAGDRVMPRGAASEAVARLLLSKDLCMLKAQSIDSLNSLNLSRGNQ